MTGKVKDLFRLEGKTVLITGASSGLGQACAVAASKAGARLILSGRDEEKLAQTHKLLSGGEHRIVTADQTDPVQLNALADECTELDGVVHSAGIHGVAPAHLVQRKFLTHVLDTNYIAPILLTQRLLFRKKIRSGSSIVFMSSIAAKAGTAGVGPYSGSKAALIGSMRPLALEVAKHKIRVNALCPGIVKTPLFAGNDAWLSDNEKSYPLGLGEPEDVAHACLFFLSDASRMITGTAFSLDGGVPFV